MKRAINSCIATPNLAAGQTLQDALKCMGNGNPVTRRDILTINGDVFVMGWNWVEEKGQEEKKPEEKSDRDTCKEYV